MKQSLDPMVVVRVVVRRCFNLRAPSKIQHNFIYDSTEYWRDRAKLPGSVSVWWTNEHYNRAFAAKRKEVLRYYVEKHELSGIALDAGCGLADLSHCLAELGFKQVDAVDLPEMIARARDQNWDPSIRFIASSLEEYKQPDGYDFILLFGVLIAGLRPEQRRRRALDNILTSCKPNGFVFVCEPFHASRYLARPDGRIATKDFIEYMKMRGFTMIDRGCIMFWPIRVFLTDFYPESDRKIVERLFYLGERSLGVLGERWSDYKMILFRRQ